MKNNKKEPFLDRVLLHSKNADERLFDMVLRFITFVILIIIVWIYADLVHAKADGINVTSGTMDFTTLSEYTSLPAENVLLTFDKIISNLNDKNVTTSSIPQGQFYSNYTSLKQYDYITDDFLNNLPLPNNISGNNISANGLPLNIDNLTLENNDFYVYITNISDTHFQYYVVFIYPEYQWKYGYNEVTYNYAQDYEWSNYYAFRYYVSFDYNVNNNSWSAGLGADRYDNNSSRCPIFSNGIVWYCYDGVNGVIANDFQENFGSSITLCCDLNFVHYNNLIGSGNVGESNDNHLYFEDVQIGLTGQSANQDITSSEVIIGVSVDDWVLNHINDFYVNCSYHFHMKDSLTGSPDPDFTVHKIVPLQAFINSGYSYSILDLFQEGNFLSYYNNIKSTHQISVSTKEGWIYSNSIVPTLLRNASYVFTDYFVNRTTSTSGNYTIFDFGLDVSVQLSNGALGGAGNMSYPYTKAFDFLNGSSSVTSAEGLRNHNPWLGETTPQANPLVPQGQGGVSGGNGGYYGGGNTQVNVDVSGQKIPMNVDNKQSMLNTLNDYTESGETLLHDVRELSNAESQNNFYAVLSNTVPMIPGISIFLKYVALTCAVMLILLVLKVLLF